MTREEAEYSYSVYMYNMLLTTKPLHLFLRHVTLSLIPCSECIRIFGEWANIFKWRIENLRYT